MQPASDNTGHALTIDPSIFREYDIRGIVGDTLNVEVARHIGQAFASHLRQIFPAATSIAVGYDGRLSSPELEEALVGGILDTGLGVVRVGLCPTPLLYVATKLLPTDAGIMITGSHNPPDYNGFKCIFAGKPFYGEQIQELKHRILARDYRHDVPGNIRNEDMMPAYLARLTAAYKAPKGLNVVWDAGNGAAGDAVTALAAQIPGTHRLINCTIDGTFPAHHPDPTVPKYLTQLIDTVKEEGADLGIAFDGDGDRIGVVDANGNILWGDQLLQLLAEEILDGHPGSPLIADVKASQQLFDKIKELGGKPVMWKTGHSLIKAKMAELDAPLAGEMSGHIFFRDQFNFDDALYAAVRLLNLLASRNINLAEWYASLPTVINTPEIRIDCEESKKFAIIEAIHDKLRKSGTEFSDVDGIRMQTDDGWWLLRASNTQAVLVARCEAKSEAGLNRLKQIVMSQLEAQGIETDLG